MFLLLCSLHNLQFTHTYLVNEKHLLPYIVSVWIGSRMVRPWDSWMIGCALNFRPFYFM